MSNIPLESLSDKVRKKLKLFDGNEIFDNLKDGSISSGSLLMNFLVSRNIKFAFEPGRIIEVFGPEQSFKTHLLLHFIAESQKSGNNAAMLDTEHRLNMSLAKTIGVDFKKFLYAKPDTAEETFDLIIDISETSDKTGIKIIGVDSIDAMTPLTEIQGDMDEQHMGLMARCMGKGLRKIKGVVSKYGMIIYFINQTRSNIGGYGSPVVRPGGNAMKFYASTIVQLKSLKSKMTTGRGDLSDFDVPIGNLIEFIVLKTAHTAPYQSGEIWCGFGQKLSRGADAILLGLRIGAIIKKGGGWLTLAYRGISEQKVKKKIFTAELSSNDEAYNDLVTHLEKWWNEKGVIVTSQDVGDDDDDEVIK